MLLSLLLCCLLLAGAAAAAPTTELRIVRYAADGITVLDEKRVDYRWMEATLPVYGDGETHYYHQGPVFEGDPWNPAEDVNVLEKDMGAVKGTSLRDLCNLVGGVSEGETVTVRASDGYRKTFPYRYIYHPDPRQGEMVITWYRAEDGCVPDYRSGMRLVFFADTSTNPWGIHAFGVSDMRECFAEEDWYFFQPGLPTTTGLSVQYVSEILIHSNEEPTGSIEITSTPAGAAVFLDGEETGLFTPCSLAELEVGHHSLSLELEGYARPYDRWVQVRPDAPADIHFDLVRETGSVRVTSAPSGAAILLDGNETNNATPATLAGVATGEHTITLVLDGYENVTVTVEVEADVQEQIDVALPRPGDPAMDPGRVEGAGENISLDPPPTTVPTDPTPLPHTGGESGDAGRGGVLDAVIRCLRDLLARLFGWPEAAPEPVSRPDPLPQETAGTAPAPEETPKREPQPPTANRSGGIFIRSSPDGAAISIDNVAISRRTPQVVYGLRGGYHAVTLAMAADGETAAPSDTRFATRFVWVYPDAVAPVLITPSMIEGVRTLHRRTITITSTSYAGEELTADGEYPPYTLPAAVELERSGAFVTIRRNGTYLSYRVADWIEDGGTFAIEPGKDAPYSVHIESAPAGAAIFVDGFLTGEKTPCTVGGLSDGEHRFLISLPGYLPAEGTVRILPGQRPPDTGVIRCTLEAYPSGSLRVESTPPGGKIHLYGRFTGETTPHTFAGMQIGTYTVKVVGDGGSEGIRDVTVTAGDITRCTIPLGEV